MSPRVPPPSSEVDAAPAPGDARDAGTPARPHPADIAFAGYSRASWDLDDDAEVEPLSLEDAKAHRNGDTLADFLVSELHEGTEGIRDYEAQLEQAANLLDRTIREIEAARRAIDEALVMEQLRRTSDRDEVADLWLAMARRTPRRALAFARELSDEQLAGITRRAAVFLLQSTDDAVREAASALIVRLPRARRR